jgi:hypothetical protein
MHTQNSYLHEGRLAFDTSMRTLDTHARKMHVDTLRAGHLVHPRHTFEGSKHACIRGFEAHHVLMVKHRV